MKNETFRQEIKDNCSFDFDKIQIIDLAKSDGIAKKYFLPTWYESTLKTLTECFDQSIPKFSSARKIATLCAEKSAIIHKQWQEGYFSERIIPTLARRREGAAEAEILIKEWKQRFHYLPKSVIYLQMHEEFTTLCEKVGGIEKLKEIFSIVCRKHDIGEFDMKLCDLKTYSKVITFFLTADYNFTKYFEQLIERPAKIFVYGAPRAINTLVLQNNEMNEAITIGSGRTINVEGPIILEIYKDVLEHTSSVLAQLMKEGKYLTGGPANDIYSMFFSLPSSQYIIIWKKEKIEVWACDPKVDGMIENIVNVRETYLRTGRLEEANPRVVV